MQRYFRVFGQLISDAGRDQGVRNTSEALDPEMHLNSAREMIFGLCPPYGPGPGKSAY